MRIYEVANVLSSFFSLFARLEVQQVSEKELQQYFLQYLGPTRIPLSEVYVREVG